MIRNPGIASIPVEEGWIDEAGEELESYKTQPFLPSFMQAWGLNPNGSRHLADKIGEIKGCIRDPEHALRLDDLADYLDELKLNGRQIIYLWRLKDGEQAYLAELARIPEHHDLVWRAEEPVLSEVRHSRLRFKWVCTRHYFIEVPGTPPTFEPRTQRAVSFFFVDLESGEAELRIQSLPDGSGLPSHAEEFARYRAEVAKVIDLDRFVPVEIEPVANQWLKQAPRGLVITSWRVARPNGQILYGGGGQSESFARKLELLFGEHTVKRATFRWDCGQRSVRHPLYLTLDGTDNAVDFNGRADASRVDFLLDLIRHDPRRKTPARKRVQRRSLVDKAEEAAKKAGRPRLRKAMKPAGWTITPFALFLYNQLVSWTGSQVEEMLGNWLMPVKIAAVLFLAALHFDKVLGLRIWRPFQYLAVGAATLLGFQRVKGVLDELYRMWIASHPAARPV